LYTDAHPDTGATPTSYRYGPNRIDLGGTPIDVGFSIDLTIEPAVQALAQRTAACYTGRQDICRALGISRSEDAGHAIGQRMLEQAVVRMAAIAFFSYNLTIGCIFGSYGVLMAQVFGGGREIGGLPVNPFRLAAFSASSTPSAMLSLADSTASMFTQ
jgi:hypothetical protein